MNRKILHVVGDSQFGGGAVLILSLAQASAKNGYQVDVLTTNPQFQRLAIQYGLGVVDIECIWRKIRPLHDLLGLLRLYSYLVKHHYYIVHTHTSKAGLIGRAAASLAKVPVVVHTVHGFAFHEQSSVYLVKVHSAIEKLAAHWCNKIVTVSHYHRSWALKLGICKPERIVAIPNGISPSRIEPSVDRETFLSALGIDSNSIVLVSAGRLAHQKGIEYLIDAVRLLVDNGVRNLRVLLAGDGPLREFLEDRVDLLGLRDNIFFLGFRTDVADIINSADVLVMPTEREGLSISLLEAMASAKPFVTTTIGSNEEVTLQGQFGRLVSPKDVPALASAIAELLGDMSAAKERGEAARSHFYALYTEEVMQNAYHELYHELVLKSKNRF